MRLLDLIMAFLLLAIMGFVAVGGENKHTLSLLTIYLFVFAYFEYIVFAKIKELEEEVKSLKMTINELHKPELEKKYIEIFGLPEKDVDHTYRKKFNLTEEEVVERYKRFEEFKNRLLFKI